MKPQSLDHFRSVVAVYRSGSVSEAARSLGLSQPTVSAHLRAVEELLGQQLFERQTSGLVPTAAAHELARTAGSHVDALDDLLYPAPSARGRALRVGGAAEFLSEVVAPRLTTVLADVGGSVSLRFGLADDLLAALAADELDVVVSAVQPRTKGLRAVPLFDEEFLLLAAPSWLGGSTEQRQMQVQVQVQAPDARGGAGAQAAPAEPAAPAARAASASPSAPAEPTAPTPPGSGAAPAAPASLAAIERIPLVAYAEHLPIVRRYWRTVFDRRPDSLAVAAVLPDLIAIRSSLIAGAGMSVLPSYLVGGELERGELVVLHEPAFAPLNSVYLVTRSGAEGGDPTITSFAESLGRLVRNPPGR